MHDLATMLLVTMIMVHVYFALRPEKLWFTRSMIRGWITGEEYLRHHDPERWPMPPEVVDSETETKADASRGGVAGD